MDGDDDEGAAARHLRDDGHELRVDGAELGVVRVLRDLQVVVTLLAAGRVAIDVPELRTSHATEP